MMFCEQEKRVLYVWVWKSKLSINKTKYLTSYLFIGCMTNVWAYITYYLKYKKYDIP